jgi:hypothetical protein
MSSHGLAGPERSLGMYSTAPRLHLRRVIFVGSVAVVALAASSASGRGAATNASSKFTGNACSLVNAPLLGGDSISGPCRHTNTVDAKGGPYKVIYAGDWGSVAASPETGAADHALAITVITPAQGYLALVQAEYKQEIAAGKDKSITGLVGGYTIMPYVYSPDQVTPSDPVRKGFYGNAAFISKGYLCTVSFYDRSPTDPPTANGVEVALLTIVSAVEAKV